jgi:NAD(P)H-hydrate epimerase
MPAIATAAQMRHIEAEADAAGYSYASMMRAAGEAAAQRIVHHITTFHLDPSAPARITLLIGRGSNGGDGLIAGIRTAALSGALVRFYLVHPRNPDDPLIAEARAAGLFIASAHDDQRYRVLTQLCASADILVDAIFGLGVRLPLPSETTRILKIAAAERAPHQKCIAIDLPSGVHPDTGEADPHTLPADETVTFIAAKPGLLHSPALRYVGRLTVASAGVPDDLPALSAIHDRLVSVQAARPFIPSRQPDSNKGTFGKVLIIGGCSRYLGAPGLTGQAAYRVGAGLVTIASTRTVIQAIAPSHPEITWLPCPESAAGYIDESAADPLSDAIRQSSALIIGPGMGQSDGLRALLPALLQTARAANIPTLLDADALNLLANMPDFHALLPPRTLLTPHPGEMARLTGRLTTDIQSDRLNSAKHHARTWGCTVLLKGAYTVIADSETCHVLPFKTSALAKAGTGDVLSGLIGGLMPQAEGLLHAAVLGGILHGLAALEAEKRFGSAAVMASDLLAPEVIGAAWRAVGSAAAHHDVPLELP